MLTYINRDGDRDGRFYLLLNTYNDSEAMDGADVFATLINPLELDEWARKMALAKDLKLRHEIAAIVYSEKEGDVLFAIDDEADELPDSDVGQPPDWDNPANMNTVDLIVTENTLIWEGITKSDHAVRTATVWDYELAELRANLGYLEEKK